MPQRKSKSKKHKKRKSKKTRNGKHKNLSKKNEGANRFCSSSNYDDHNIWYEYNSEEDTFPSKGAANHNAEERGIPESFADLFLYLSKILFLKSPLDDFIVILDHESPIEDVEYVKCLWQCEICMEWYLKLGWNVFCEGEELYVEDVRIKLSLEDLLFMDMKEKEKVNNSIPKKKRGTRRSKV